MIKPITSCLAATILISATAIAQTTKSDVKKEDKKEIIIEKKEAGKTDKMVIEVDGEQVMINGKPAAEYKGDQYIMIDDDIIINGNSVSVPGKSKTYYSYSTSNAAMLGVITEKDSKGAKVKEVKKGSAAEKAGLKPGDIITGVNDTKIETQEDLVKTIGKYKPDDVANLTYTRAGKQYKAKAKLDKSNTATALTLNSDSYRMRIDPPIAMVGPRGPRSYVLNDNDMWAFRMDRPKYGMSIEDNADGDGVVINEVEAESNAMKAGLQKGDIITEAGGKPIKGVDDFRDLLADSREQSSVAMKVLRNGSTVAITVRVPKVIRKADL